MNIEFDKILNYEYIIDIINEMILMIYEMKRKKWKIEFEWDLYWNIIDYRFSKEKLILYIIEIIKKGEKRKIEELKLRLNEKEYMIYEIKLYINIKVRELRRILNYKYNFEYDREKMKMELNMNEWICLEDNDVFIDEIYEEEKKENEKE